MSVPPWILTGIAAYSIGVTLLTSWLAAGPKRPILAAPATGRTLLHVVSSAIWMGLLYVLGVLGIRYVERMPNGTAGYLMLATLGFLLSWARAKLYRRVQEQPRPAQEADRHALLASMFLHNLNYLLLALTLYLVLVWLFRMSFRPPLLIPLWIGALLPDLDSRDSLPGRLVPCVPRWLASRFEHLGAWHTPAAAIAVGLASAPLGLLFGEQVAYLILLGFLAHLIVDMLAPRGIMLLWPWKQTRYSVLNGPLQELGGVAERILSVGLALTAATLFLLVDLEGPRPASTAAPSYRQTLERYYSMRGKNQVFAYIEGSWQVSGHPLSGWFEILNASGESYVLRDRYDGMIFSAGQRPNDNVYLSRVVLRAGSAITVKPVEIQLDHDTLSDALGIIYAMQAEPGLQYIYISGELRLLPPQEAIGPLRPDLNQKSLRQIRLNDDGHYSLQYLTAGDLIALSNVQMEAAELIITATYAQAEPGGPTVTPLPSPPTGQALEP